MRAEEGVLELSLQNSLLALVWWSHSDIAGEPTLLDVAEAWLVLADIRRVSMTSMGSGPLITASCGESRRFLTTLEVSTNVERLVEWNEETASYSGL